MRCRIQRQRAVTVLLKAVSFGSASKDFQLVSNCISQPKNASSLAMDFVFGPLERGCVLVPAPDKGFDRLDQHSDAGETATF
jgi:hypothetical protein